MNEAPRGQDRWWKVSALAWLLLVVAVGIHQWQFWRQGHLNTDVMALLPENEQAPEVALATRKLAQQSSRRILVMVGAPEWSAAQAAAQAFRQALEVPDTLMHPAPQAAAAGPDALLGFYRPWRDRLLTPEQRERLQAASTPALVGAALTGLYQPAAGTRLSDWASDPLGLWPQWWTQRAAQSRARPRDGEMWVFADGLEWVVLPYEIEGSPFALDGKAIHGTALRKAEAAAVAAVPGARMLAAGLPLHAEAAAVQASHEINTIGWGSLAAVLVLVWLCFRSLRPIALVALSLVTGTAVALSVTAVVFGEVHLLTLVFGASLIGVAEDYGIHYFASRQGRPGVPPASLMGQLLPGLLLALATSVVAYLVLGLAPFPGLRQMALFSATGLIAAFLTVACWFPWLDRGVVPRSGFADAIGASLSRWPRLRASPATSALAVGALVFCGAGAVRLHSSDDIRQLQSSPAALVQAQVEVGRLLGIPSVAQFFLVRGESVPQVLEREEVLKTRLDALVSSGRLAGYRAISDWVPSPARQQADARLTASAEARVFAGVNAAVGESLVRPVFAAGPLTVQEWLRQPVSAAARDLWLGEVGGQWTSAVMLLGLHDRSTLPALQSLADPLRGVQWVDKAEEASSLLGRYRVAMVVLLLAGHAVVLAALWLRYRRRAWRAWLPTALASLITVATLGWIGQPFQLFNVLALALLLGIGVDYGIFLLEHAADGAAWLAVVVGAATTWLAFGLLALSGTPALQTFGLTLLIGIALVWGISPLLRVPQGAKQ